MSLKLFVSPRDAADIIREAGLLSSACDLVYHFLTGKENKLENIRYKDGKSVPVIAAVVRCGYWMLETNDINFHKLIDATKMIQRAQGFTGVIAVSPASPESVRLITSRSKPEQSGR